MDPAHRFDTLPISVRGVFRASPFTRGLAGPSRRIEFVILRTGRSPSVAPHPASLRRSYGRLQAGEGLPGGDSHPSDKMRSRAHYRQRPAGLVFRSGRRSTVRPKTRPPGRRRYAPPVCPPRTASVSLALSFALRCCLCSVCSVCSVVMPAVWIPSGGRFSPGAGFPAMIPLSIPPDTNKEPFIPWRTTLKQRMSRGTTA